MAFGRSNTRCTCGSRRSASTTITLLPARASVTARLHSVSVLPSPFTKLVTTIDFNEPSMLLHSRLRRSTRNASLTLPSGLWKPQAPHGRSPVATSAARARSPRARECRATARYERTRVSNCATTNASTTPRKRPAMKPNTADFTGLGDTGDDGGCGRHDDLEVAVCAGLRDLQIAELLRQHRVVTRELGLRRLVEVQLSLDDLLGGPPALLLALLAEIDDGLRIGVCNRRGGVWRTRLHRDGDHVGHRRCRRALGRPRPPKPSSRPRGQMRSPGSRAFADCGAADGVATLWTSRLIGRGPPSSRR